MVLTTAVKFADLNHAAKPTALHRDWSMRITNEFWALGDKEKKLGVPISPLCDRIKLSLQVVIHEDHLGLRIFYETLD